MYKYFLHFKDGKLIGWDKASEFVTIANFPQWDSVEVTKEQFEEAIQYEETT